jgi:hypothetical protein
MRLSKLRALGLGGRERIGDDGEVVLIWHIFLARETRKLLNFAVAGAKLIALDNGGGWVPYWENAIAYELVPPMEAAGRIGHCPAAWRLQGRQQGKLQLDMK